MSEVKKFYVNATKFIRYKTEELTGRDEEIVEAEYRSAVAGGLVPIDEVDLDIDVLEVEDE
jgi:hypothetical protein